MLYGELPANIRYQYIKNIGKKIGNVLDFVNSLHITKLYKTILHQKISVNSHLYHHLSECNLWQTLGFCGCLTLVLILFVSHGMYYCCYRDSCCLHFQGEVTTQWPTVTEPRTGGSTSASPTKGKHFFW